MHSCYCEGVEELAIFNAGHGVHKNGFQIVH